MALEEKINIWNDLFSVFSGFNIIEWYDRMPWFFDFTIYLILFVGLAQTIFQKHFSGRGGKAVIIALGIALSFGMVFAGRQYDFNLKSLGSVSFIIFLSLISIFIFKAIIKAGMHKGITVLLAYVFIYLAVLNIAPEFINTVLSKIPFLRAVFYISIIIIGIRLISEIIGKNKLNTPFKSKPRIILPAENLSNEKKELIEENSSLHKQKTNVRKEKQRSNKIEHNLNSLKDLIMEYNKTGSSDIWGKIRKTVGILLKKESKTKIKLSEIITRSNKIENLDLEILPELKREFTDIPDKQKIYVIKEIQNEKQKINIEERIKNIDKAITKTERNFKYCLQQILTTLQTGQFDEAAGWTEKAGHFEIQKEKQLKNIQKLDKEINRLNHYALKTVKKMR